MSDIALPPQDVPPPQTAQDGDPIALLGAQAIRWRWKDADDDAPAPLVVAAPATAAASTSTPASTTAPTDAPVLADAFEFDADDAAAPVAEAASWWWGWGRFAAPAAAAAPASAGPSAADFTGAGKAVVVIDDGWSPYYDQSNTVFAYDFSGRDDADAARWTINSHGSWVAQTVTDVAGDVDIIHLKVFPDWSGGASLRDIEQALDWVIGATTAFDIAAVNLSLGFGNATAQSLTGLSDEFAALSDLGVFNVVAAGNSGATYADGVNVLAADPNVIGVSATDDAGAFAGFSQRSATLTDIAADGVGVEVETFWGATGAVNGTSFAAPYVSGAAARMQDAADDLIGRSLSEDEFLDILRLSGDAVVGAPAAAGYVEADADAAVAWFIDNHDAYADPLIG